MKKIIAAFLFLLIGLMVIGGCSSTKVSTANQQTTEQQNTNTVNSEPQNNQQQDTASNIPQPPALPEE